MDGPVVKAARAALGTADVHRVLSYVPKEGEAEVTSAFARAMRARGQGPEASEVADLYFLENVVRVHRAGEGAPYTGLKPAGLDHGPVIPLAERAIETSSPDALVKVLTETVQLEIEEKFHELMDLKQHAEESGDSARAYVGAMLGLQVYAHKIYTCAKAGLHESHEQPHDD